MDAILLLVKSVVRQKQNMMSWQVHSSRMKRRKLNLKANFESGASYFGFKR